MPTYQQSNSIHHHHQRIEHYTDFNFFLHLHRDFEFILMQEGSMELFVQGRKEQIRAGQAALILSNQPHSISTPGHSRCIVVNFSAGYVGAFVHALSGKEGVRSVFNMPEALFQYLYDTFRSVSYPDTLASLRIKATCYAVCDAFLTQVPLVKAQQADNDVLHMLLSYVEEHFQEDINMQTAAQAIGYGANYLSRYFHQYVDINFRQYVNQCRIDYACELLNQESFNLAQIALDSGFQTVRSFNRAFKKCTGTTPSGYRMNIGLRADDTSAL
ncbi:MAG: helix-turn-helix domain-containing protein [Aristaeellaceae bacterium]